MTAKIDVAVLSWLKGKRKEEAGEYLPFLK